jgi:hypothetical protein
MQNSPTPPATAALSDAETCDVLSYWLALLRHQEALANRPRARRPDRDAGLAAEAPPNLQEPVPGQEYAKLDWSSHEPFVVARRGNAELAVAGEVRAFFEDWLATAYRRGEDEAAKVGYLLSFPTVLVQRDELAGLLRCPIELSWLDAEGKRFVVPGSRERARGNYPPVPVQLRLAPTASDDEEALPFFVDNKLLRDTLRIDGERLDAFFAGLRQKQSVKAKTMIEALSAMIESQLDEDEAELGARQAPAAAKALEQNGSTGDASAQLLERLQWAVARRLTQLRSRSRCYPIALIVNGDRSRATAHAQRDIDEALTLIQSKALPARSPLSRYLRGQVLNSHGSEKERCLARDRPTGLTPTQRSAIDQSLRDRLSAIQGPPGTGKTTLILNRIADQLVKKLVPLLSGYAVSDDILVVTSTNNAAVDNVTSPLGSGVGSQRLPIAVRVGSRDVTERLTVADLEQCRAWLERQKPAEGEFERALAAFRSAYEAAGARPQPAQADVEDPEGEAIAYALFEAARTLREAWAVHNRVNLLNVLSLGVRAAQNARSLRKLLENPSGGGTWLKRLFPAWGSTLLSLGNVFPPEPDCCAHMIVDEAGQCHPGYAVSALLRAHSALVIGDVHQLEPVINLSREDEERIWRSARLRISLERLAPYRTYDDSGSSAQALADRAASDRPTLVDHFRCQPEIAAICDRLCNYGLRPHAPRRSRGAQLPALSYPVLFTPITGEQVRAVGSWRNPAEAAAIVLWVLRLLGAGIAPDEIGVITPFRGQLEHLWRELGAARVPLEQPRTAESDNLELFGGVNRGLCLGTVHRFQGGEKNIILFSTTVTRTGSLGFLDDRVNLVNVAASRAREHLITLGHELTLRSGRHTPALIEHATRVDVSAIA